MANNWADDSEELPPLGTLSKDESTKTTSTPTPSAEKSTYVPPHLRNRQGSGGGGDFGRRNDFGGRRDYRDDRGGGTFRGGGWGGSSRGNRDNLDYSNSSFGRRDDDRRRDDGGRRGWDTGRSSRFRESDPFAKMEAEDRARAEGADAETEMFQTENHGLNFDAYEDIPVEVSGNDAPKPIEYFKDVDFGREINANIERCKFKKPTPVQRHAIPISLAGRDLMACAQTGSGKTAAFCFPIICGILNRGLLTGSGGQRGRKTFPLALVLSPTRELAIQIHEEARKFAYKTGCRAVVVYGGAPAAEQFREMERGCDILIATPGRLIDLIDRGKVGLAKCEYLALDEADRMLDMGFEPQIRQLVEQRDMPRTGERQTMLFSATFPKEIQRMAADFLHDYVFLTVGRIGSSTELINQTVCYVPSYYDKTQMLLDLTEAVPGLTLVFVETKRGADQLEDFLCEQGKPATSIHGDRTQQEREAALKSFRAGRTPILVATDVAARGLDIPHVTHVVNFDLPTDIDDYVHRIGRTGRAGKKGQATALFGDKDAGIARALMDVMSEAGQEVPSFLGGFASRSSYGGRSKGRSGGGSRYGGRDYRNHGGGGGGGGYGGGGGGYGGGGGGYGGGGYGGGSYGGGGSSWD